MRTVVAHTADLDPALLARLKPFLFEIFDEFYDEDAWDHALGGMHVVVLDGDAIAGHGAVVARRLRHAGAWLRTGYVESVAVSPDFRRRGIGGTVMAEVERVIRGGYALGALAASDAGAPLYASRGWTLWRGALSELRPDGVAATDGDESIFVLEVDAAVDPDGELTCDWRDGDPW